MASFVSKKFVQDMMRMFSRFVKRLSPMSAASCDRVGSSAVHKLSSTARRIEMLQDVVYRPRW